MRPDDRWWVIHVIPAIPACPVRPRADIRPMPAFVSTRPTARAKINVLKSRRSARVGCRAVRDSTLLAWYHFFTHLAREGRMTVTSGRWELLAALGGAAAAWPSSGRAQQSAKIFCLVERVMKRNGGNEERRRSGIGSRTVYVVLSFTPAAVGEQ